MKLNADRIVSSIAMLIGLSSLFIIIYQTALLREQQKASVLPYLMILMVANSNETSIAVRNTGLGPALIEDAVIHYQGREIRKDPYDFYLEVRPEAAKEGLSVDKLIPGRLVSTGEFVRVLGSTGSSAQAMVSQVLSLFDIGEVPQAWYDSIGVARSGPDKAIIEITYTSVYGDRWRVTSDRYVPERL